MRATRTHPAILLSTAQRLHARNVSHAHTERSGAGHSTPFRCTDKTNRDLNREPTDEKRTVGVEVPPDYSTSPWQRWSTFQAPTAIMLAGPPRDMSVLELSP